MTITPVGRRVLVSPEAEPDQTASGLHLVHHAKPEVAGAVGIAFSLVTDDDKVNESALFVDAEVNKYLGGRSFIGTGLSLWDLTRSETFTPAWLLHVGVPVTKGDKHRVFIVGEGRLFLDHADDIANNYLIWGGVRVQFAKR